MTETTAHPTDDLVAAFQIEGWPLRGRIVRLGGAIDEVLTRHDYPEAVANLLGEACALAALVGAATAASTPSGWRRSPAALRGPARGRCWAAASS